MCRPAGRRLSPAPAPAACGLIRSVAAAVLPRRSVVHRRGWCGHPVWSSRGDQAMRKPAAREQDGPDVSEVRVTLGVDTHADVHVGVALDQLGRRLGHCAVPTTAGGYAHLVAWARRLGALERVGIEGAGGCGAGPTRWLRARLRPLSLAARVATAAAFRPGPRLGTPTAAAKPALQSVARRYRQLGAEIEALDAQLADLAARAAPALLAVKGVGTDTAPALLAAAGDNPERLRSEAAFARLCGVAPLPASSAKTTRYRPNRGGNRDANRALHLLAVRRLAWDPRTRADAARRTAQGKTKPEILRCLKRYLARELYPLLTSLPSTSLEAPSLAA